MDLDKARNIIGLLLFDAFLLTVTFASASFIRFEIFLGGPNALFHGAPVLDYGVLGAVAVPVWLAIFWSQGLYRTLDRRSETRGIVTAVAAGTITFLAADYLLQLQIARGWSLSCLVIAICTVGGGRALLRRYRVGLQS